jgi:hypothetical protein
MGDWRLLGSFIGKDHHQAQDFKLLFPAWAKFLKIRLLSHYGNEHFCTVSTVKVFGTSMLEDMKREIIIDTPRPDMDNEASVEPVESPPVDEVVIVSPKSSVAAIAPWSAWNESDYSERAALLQRSLSRSALSPSTQQISGQDFCYYGSNDGYGKERARRNHDQAQSSIDCEAPSRDETHREFAQTISNQRRRQAEIDTLGKAKAQALAYAQLLAAQTAPAASADENPFRTITNKIRVLDANHSATILAVEGLILQYQQLSEEIFQTVDGRNAAVAEAQAILIEHENMMRQAYHELQKMVRVDSERVFREARRSVELVVAANVSATLQTTSLQHSTEMRALQQQCDMLALLVAFSTLVSIAHCFCGTNQRAAVGWARSAALTPRSLLRRVSAPTLPIRCMAC